MTELTSVVLRIPTSPVVPVPFIPVISIISVPVATPVSSSVPAPSREVAGAIRGALSLASVTPVPAVPALVPPLIVPSVISPLAVATPLVSAPVLPPAVFCSSAVGISSRTVTFVSAGRIPGAVRAAVSLTGSVVVVAAAVPVAISVLSTIIAAVIAGRIVAAAGVFVSVGLRVSTVSFVDFSGIFFGGTAHSLQRHQVLVFLVHAGQRGFLFGPSAGGLLFLLLLHAAAEVVKALFVDLHGGGGDAVLPLVEALACSVTVLSLRL